MALLPATVARIHAAMDKWPSWTLQRIADHLGLSLGTVKNASYRRGRRKKPSRIMAEFAIANPDLTPHDIGDIYGLPTRDVVKAFVWHRSTGLPVPRHSGTTEAEWQRREAVALEWLADPSIGLHSARALAVRLGHCETSKAARVTLERLRRQGLAERVGGQWKKT